MPIPIHSIHPALRLLPILILWIVQLVIGYFVYRDAGKQKMSAPLWFILVIIPVFGFPLAVLYAIIREVRQPVAAGNAPLAILGERFARGEITAEEYEKGRALLGRD
jgi:uncharacterized membrane protein